MTDKHAVEILYKPEGDNLDTLERLNFSTAKAAREFAKRQDKIESVIHAKYRGIQE